MHTSPATARHSTRRRFLAASAPLLTLPALATAAWPRSALVRAVERLEEARRRVEEANRLGDAALDRGAPYDEQCRLDALMNAAVGARTSAEEEIIRVVLASGSPGTRPADIDPRRHYPAAGMVHAGRLYVAHPDPGSDVPLGESEEWYDVMQLAVIDLGRVAGLA